MYVKQPKKLLILNILDILRKYSDEDHRLSQREIGEIFDRTENWARVTYYRAKTMLAQRLEER